MLGNENDKFSLIVSSGRSSDPSVEVYNKPQGLYECEHWHPKWFKRAAYICRILDQ